MSDLSIEIVEGHGAGRRVPLTGPIEIGRDPAVAIALDDPQVSRHHARISPADGGAVVEDLGSTNSTFVNGHEVYLPTRIAPGDTVVIGTTVLELRNAAQIAARPSAVVAIPPALAVAERKPDFVPPEVAAGSSSPEELTALLDSITKRKARVAPLALFALVVLAVSLWLALR